MKVLKLNLGHVELVLAFLSMPDNRNYIISTLPIEKQDYARRIVDAYDGGLLDRIEIIKGKDGLCVSDKCESYQQEKNYLIIGDQMFVLGTYGISDMLKSVDLSYFPQKLYNERVNAFG